VCTVKPCDILKVKNALVKYACCVTEYGMCSLAFGADNVSEAQVGEGGGAADEISNQSACVAKYDACMLQSEPIYPLLLDI
jgi:hypothetical protein